jgi:putative membrane protein
MSGGGWMLMTAFWLLIAAVVTVAIVRALAGRPAPVDNTERARGILAERFARGEIEAEEYRERLDELDQHQLPT